VTTTTQKVRDSSLINEYTYRDGHDTVVTPRASEYIDWSTPLSELPSRFVADGQECRVIGEGPTATVTGAPDPVLDIITDALQAQTPDPSLPSKLSPEEIYNTASIISKRSIDPATGMYTNAPPSRFAALPADYAGLVPERTRYFRHGAVEVFALPLRSELADVPLVDKLYSFRRPDVVVSDMARPPSEPLAFFADPLSAADRAAGAYVSPSELSDRNFLLYASAQLTPGYVAAAVAESMAIPHDRALVKPKPEPEPAPEVASLPVPEAASEAASKPASEASGTCSAASYLQAGPGSPGLPSTAVSVSTAAADADTPTQAPEPTTASAPPAPAVPLRRWGLGEDETAPELILAGRPLAVSRLNLAYRRGTPPFTCLRCIPCPHASLTSLFIFFFGLL
jgi:hypothetical protein